MLLFGVLVFSYIMGEYVNLLDTYKTSNLEYDDGDALTLFFNVMKKFNLNEDMDIDMRKHIEDYFTHRWENYKNQPF